MPEIMTNTGGRGDDAGDEREKKKKKTLGRRKIRMERIEKMESRQVTFSKRRMGLFRKAGELAMLCDAQVLVIVFSPAGRAYTFGNPLVPIVVDRFVNPSLYDTEAAAAVRRRIKADRDELERQMGYLTTQLKEVEHWGEELDKAVQAAGVWIDGDVKQWELPLLEATLAALDMIQAALAQRRQEMVLAFTQQAMMQFTGGAGDGSHLHYLGSGSSSTSDGTGGHDVMAVDTTLKLMGGNVSHGLAPAPVMQPPLPPPPPVALLFINGFGYNYLSASAGYGHYQGDGHVAFNGAEGVYGTTPNNFS